MTALSSDLRLRAARSLAWTGAMAVPVLVAWQAPGAFPWLIGALLAAGGLVLAWRHLTQAWILWMLVAGLSLEMTLSDLVGPEAFQSTIAAVKGLEIGLAGLTILRHGAIMDPLNPAWAFAAMAAAGAVVGIHPALTSGDMVRSFVGSVTPFLVFFCATPPGWGDALRRAIGFAPMAAIALGALCDLVGLRPLFVDSGGMRLAALGHPAFLANVCLPAIYAVLLQWLRDGAPRTGLLLAANFAILILTGARAPMAYATLVVVGSLIFAPNAAVPRVHRWIMCLAGLTAVPVVFVLGESYSSLRLFAVIAGEASDLSGRQLLWPAFRAAAARAPWFGWGLGSGNVVLAHDGAIAQLLHTWAAHNEYLRLQVEGGYLGRTLFLALFVLWVGRRTARLAPAERLVMRIVFLAYAAHAATDNVLISTPACVFYTFVAAVFAGSRDRLRKDADVA